MIKNFFLFKESNENNNPKIQKLVDEANNLLNTIYNKYGKNYDFFYLYRKNNFKDFFIYSNIKNIEYKNGMIHIQYSEGREQVFEKLDSSDPQDIKIFKNFYIKMLKENLNGYKVFDKKIKDLVEQIEIFINYTGNITINVFNSYVKIKNITYRDNIIRLEYLAGFYSASKEEKKVYDKEILFNIKDLIDDFTDIISSYKEDLKYSSLDLLTKSDVDRLTQFEKNLSSYDFITKIDSEKYYKYKHKNLDNDLSSYNNMKGIKINQVEDDIIIYNIYFNTFYEFNEQFLAKVNRIYFKS